MSSDLPSQGRLQQLHAKPLSGEHLEVLGKSASARYRTGRADTLSDAVVETVKNGGLSPEQVQRVIEFANTDAFLYDFKKEGAGHRVVNIAGGPANPSDVFKDLNDGGGGTVFDRGVSDYNHPPKTKKASVEPRVEQAFEQVFAARNPEYPFVDPLAEAYDMQCKLAAAEENMTSELSLLEGMFCDLGERLYKHVKEAALTGSSLGEVVSVLSAAENATTEHVKVAFSMLSPLLVKEQVFPNGTAVIRSLEKLGSQTRIVNDRHPLVVVFDEFCQTLSKLAQIRAGREQISEGLGQIKTFLKHAADGGLIKKVYDHSGKAGEVAGHGAEWLARGLLGSASPHAQTVGKVVSTGVKHLPTAAALVAGNEVRRNLKYSPTYQGAADTALQFMPGTPQYQQREYELAVGGGGGRY